MLFFLRESSEGFRIHPCSHKPLPRVQLYSLNMNKNDEDVSKRTSSLPPWLPSFGTAALGGLLFGSGNLLPFKVCNKFFESSFTVQILDPPPLWFEFWDQITRYLVN